MSLDIHSYVTHGWINLSGRKAVGPLYAAAAHTVPPASYELCI